MSGHPINMWPNGRINVAATNDELRTERSWQIEWASEVKTKSRKNQARDNIAQIDAELHRRGVVP